MLLTNDFPRQLAQEDGTFDYAALGAKLRKEADRAEAFAKRAAWPEYLRAERLRHVSRLRWIASDCDSAVWGCEASARSVEEFLDGGAF